MKKMTLGFIACLMLLPAVCLAQANPQVPASWVAFQQQESAKRMVFFKEMEADREAFLRDHPEVKTYLEETRAAARERMAAWKAAHQK